MVIKILFNAFIIALISVFFTSCKDQSTTPVEPTTLNGAYVLYESAGAGGSDYAFLDSKKDTVFNNLYQNSNIGAALDYKPGDIKILDNRNLYIVCGGVVNQSGKIYKIGTSSNQTINFKAFGNLPGKFAVDNNNIYVSSTGASYATQLDLNLNVITDLIDVGLNPSQIAYTFNRFMICRSTYSSLNSLAVINEINNNVTTVNYSFKPVSLVNNFNGYFMSGFDRKQIYKLDSTDLFPIDSIAIPTSGSKIGDIIKNGQQILYVVADSSEVWEVNLLNNPPSTRLLIPSLGGSYKISAIAFEELNKQIYIGDNNGGPPFLGKIHIFDAASGNNIRSYDLFGRNPVGFAFKY